MMRSPASAREWRLVYGAAALLLFGFYLFSLRSVFSPVILYLAVLIVLAPYAGAPMQRNLIGASALLLGFWALLALGGALAPFILGLILAYVANPVVDSMHRRGVPRGIAILLLALPVVALLVAIVLFGIPALVDQISNLIQQLPELLERLNRWVSAMRTRFANVRLPFANGTVGDWSIDTARVTAFLQQRQAEILQRLWSTVLGVGRGVTLVLSVLGFVIVTPIITFYLLRDYAKIGNNLEQLIPEQRRESWLSFAREFDSLLSRYLRGQVIEATIVGVLTWLGLWVLGFPYPGLVGAVAGVFNLVPYLGLIVSAVPALIIALLSGNIGGSLLKAAIVFGVVQFIDGSITGPRIVGGSVGLHPVWVMVALAVAGVMFGFVGLLIAVPAAVFIKLLLREGIERYRSSTLYKGPATE